MEPVYVVSASEGERKAIGALMAPYQIELGQSGVYQYLPYYWLEPGRRFPYLIKTVDSVAGFALIRKTSSFEMAEFYVTPQFRRQHIPRSVRIVEMER